MAVDVGVRLVAEVSGDLIGHLPQSAVSLQIDTEVDYDGVTYKVEKVRYVTESSTRVFPPDGNLYSVYGRTDYIVSVVP